MGTEGIEDQDDGNLSAKGGHKQHRHHSKSHKHRKSKVHHTSVGTAEKDGLKNHGDITGLSNVRQLKPQVSDKRMEYREFPTARDKRSTPDVSEWQKILNTLKQGETGGTTHSNAEMSNTELDKGRQLEILDEIQNQLEEEIESARHIMHGHHRQQPLMDIEAKKEEIQVLKEIENSLQQTPSTEDNHAMMRGAHTHSSSHHHKHGQLHETGSKPLNDASNQPHNNHGHSKTTTHTETTSNLDELEKQVFKDILNAESDELTRKQGVELEREIESLERIEKQTTGDLIKNSGSQTK